MRVKVGQQFVLNQLGCQEIYTVYAINGSRIFFSVVNGRQGHSCTGDLVTFTQAVARGMWVMLNKQPSITNIKGITITKE